MVLCSIVKVIQITPTISEFTGGTFVSTAGLSFVSSSTEEIDLSHLYREPTPLVIPLEGLVQLLPLKLFKLQTKTMRHLVIKELVIPQL